MQKKTDTFDYSQAFSSNIGLLITEEQQELKTFTIAIPGMGGVGGAHLISLVRQGFEKFKIADLDVFKLENFNRQYGARMETIGKKKVEVMKEEALKINPDCQIEVFDNGIDEENLDDFFKDVDLAVDGLDAFVVDERQMFINGSLARSIPVITAGPIGFGTAFLIFLPGGPDFNKYFSVKDDTPYMDKLVSFFAGLVPKLLQLRYMRGASLKERRGPSSIGAVNLCAGVVAIYAIKILLKKGSIKAVPYYHQFDVMRERYVTKKLHFGNRGLIQRLKIKFAEKLMAD